MSACATALCPSLSLALVKMFSLLDPELLALQSLNIILIFWDYYFGIIIYFDYWTLVYLHSPETVSISRQEWKAGCC